MKINKYLIMLFLASSLFTACDKDDDYMIDPQPEQGQESGENEEDPYGKGVIVLNEGAQSSGTVSFLNSDLSAVENNIFETLNAGMDLGKFLQSMFFDDENAYIISNGSNLITVVNRYTFEYKDIINSGLDVPLYGITYNGKAYVSNVAGFSDVSDDYIAVINLETMAVEDTILPGNAISEIIEHDDLLYVEGASYGAGNSINVFDPASNSFVKKITTNDGLNSFAIDDNYIFALSSEAPSEDAPEEANPTTELEKIDLSTGEVVSEIIFPEDFTGAKYLDIEDGIIYFTSGTSVYSLEEDAEVAPEEPVLSYESSSAYGKMYGFEVENGYIYTSDGADFASAGSVSIYTTSGEPVSQFNVGVGPNSFYFN